MPTISQVEPGDLITADLFNKLIAAINSLDTRVTEVENEKPTGPTPEDRARWAELLRQASTRIKSAGRVSKQYYVDAGRNLANQGVPVADILVMMQDAHVPAASIADVKKDLGG